MEPSNFKFASLINFALFQMNPFLPIVLRPYRLSVRIANLWISYMVQVPSNGDKCTHQPCNQITNE